MVQCFSVIVHVSYFKDHVVVFSSHCTCLILQGDGGAVLIPQSIPIKNIPSDFPKLL